MKPYKDLTAVRAVGSADKEWRDMANLALLIRLGRYSQEWNAKKSRLFTGIYKRLLTDPIEDVEKAAGRHWKFYED